jgi:hypothetical protein
MIFNLFQELIKHIFHKKNDDLSIYFLIDYIAETSLIIFYIIENKLSKNENENEKNYNISSKLIIYIIIELILICISQYIPICHYITQYDSNNYHINAKQYYNIFLFFFFFDFILLKKNLYYHHILSIIINSIIPIFLFISSIGDEEFLINFIYFIRYYVIALFYFLIKLMNNEYFINIYLFGFFSGLIKIIFYFIDSSHKQYINEIQNQILFLIFNYLICVFHHFFKYKIIFKFEPIYSFLCIFMGEFLIPIIILNFTYKLCYCLSIISSLIYLEIIELNFLGLNINLKKNIIERGIKENNDINYKKVFIQK